MKKLVMMLALALAIFSAKAACVDWKVSGAASDVGKTVYLLTSIEGIDSVDALSASAVASAGIIKSGRTYGTGEQNAVNAAITEDSMKDSYFVIVSDDAKSFTYVKADLSGFVYDPAAQQTSPGSFDSLSVSAIAAGTRQDFGGGGGDVPEPTSGLLLLVGGAMLALRRKQK